MCHRGGVRRVGRGVQFTPQGNVLVAEAIGILDQLEERGRDLRGARYDAAPQLETVSLAPKRGQVAVQFVALGWDPR